jgi:mannose-6-phosphate isomerase-like protein (cupin superfamily)
MTRRIVTGVKDGRSCILSDEQVPKGASGLFEELWAIDAGDAFGHIPEPGVPTLEGPPGSLQWRIVTIPSDADYRRMLEAMPPERRHVVDPDGWHLTRTVDLVLVLEGAVALTLDDDEVLLHQGDVVVQQQTRHAWHCRSEGPVRVLAVMKSLPEE